MAEPWFDPVEFGAWYGGLVGGIGGTLAGILGAAIGVCAQRGVLRRTLLACQYGFIAFGLLNLAFGIVAWSGGQPWSIWYGPTLAGAILSIVMGMTIPVTRKAYAASERRRLEGKLMANL